MNAAPWLKRGSFLAAATSVLSTLGTVKGSEGGKMPSKAESPVRSRPSILALPCSPGPTKQPDCPRAPR